MKIKTLPIFLIFIAMGMVDSAGPMVSLAQEKFKLSNTVASFLPLLAYVMYGVLSVPIGLLQDKKGKKYVLNLGLTIALLGMVIPILSGMYGKMVVDGSSLAQFYKILTAILLLGAGGSILQVAGNPIMRDVSEEGQYSKNLSLAQSFITVGSSMGFLLPIIMAYAFGFDWSILFPIFASIVLVGFVLLNTCKIPEKNSGDEHHATFKSCFKLLGNGYVVAMVLGIAIYCGVETCMSAYVPIHLSKNYSASLGQKHWYSDPLLLTWSLFYLPILVGRCFGSLIMSRVAPKRLLLFTVLLALSGLALVFTHSFVLTLIGVLLVGFGLANIFPLIFSITIEHMPEHTNELSGLMVSAIAGSAFIPLAMGIIADHSSILTAFVVPVLCIVYLLFVAIINNRKVKSAFKLAEVENVKIAAK